MFKKIIDAISGLFSSLFGGGKKKPQPGTGTDTSLPNTELPQDGSEIRPDTIVIVADEMEKVVILPGEADTGFDEDIFDEDNGGPDEPIVIAPDPPKPDPQPEPATPPKPQPAPQPKGRYLWCLDNGHGKQTPGKRSPLFDDGQTRLFEYEFNRDVVARIKKQLDEKGVQYFITVPEVDIDDFLEGRVNRANAKKSSLPKIFVSIHSNAAPARSSESWAPDSISGIETWHFHGSKTGQKIASIFQKHLINETGWVNRHLKSRPDGQFYVLRKTNMSAVLTENGFYNNKAQAANLMKPEVRQKIADAHVKAILEIEKNGLESA
ncbi:MAG: N-acetylmuramoyl-L-alanine amidase [Lewinellaceae bacterium]|nr:N-acetylmuramoyl-L-alanine amidase [Phaeodactylibacter sp.]MCB0615227.1 N-acetylmuramoyl-L-alanine amidase [Phaeodactylibacter sp.]MCB9350775.1 N-acetylmuramoyl-L-alanine amidase [Lewinellaceae bacterium]